jgi:hypothetical protein
MLLADAPLCFGDCHVDTTLQVRSATLTIRTVIRSTALPLSRTIVLVLPGGMNHDTVSAICSKIRMR